MTKIHEDINEQGGNDQTHDCYNAPGNVLLLCYTTDQVLSTSESPGNEALTRFQADLTSRNNEMQPGSVKHKCSHMFPITTPGQKRPLTKQEPPKHSQASDRISTPNRKSSFKDIRGELAPTGRRANQRKEASPNLSIDEQYLVKGEAGKTSLVDFAHKL